MSLHSHLRWSTMLTVIIVIAGCATRETLTTVSPYSGIIGRRYILNEPCYIFHYQDTPKDLQLGTPRLDSNLRRAIDKTRFQKGFGSIVVNESIPQGSIFVVVEIIRENHLEASWYRYRSRLSCLDSRSFIVDISPIMNPLSNPPTLSPGVAKEQP
jgi:hypothetical protein